MKPFVLSVVVVVTAGAFAWHRTPDEAPAGVTGTVKLTGTPPANPKIDMSEEAACGTASATDPVVAVTGGNLADVLVYVKSGLPAGAAPAAPTAPVVLDQQGCLYRPRTLAVMVKQPLEIRNSDAVLHNIKAVPKKNRGFNISQPTKGMKTTRSFTAAEVAIPLQCNVHGWMHANLAVLDHPYFAVS
ncbi:MAG: hypothetical protein HY337_11675, partial [Gemmatimonadetes bacterium]|nr:hypothetical protein [Gemmatimonadota bacterium]